MTRNVKRLCVTFLVLAALTEVLVALSFDRGILVMEHYMGPLIFAFMGMTLCMGRYGKRIDLYVGAAFVGWYILSRILLKELYIDYSYVFLCNLSCAYLLAFPFAHAADDAQKKHGLTAVAVTLCLCYGAIAWLCLLAALGGQQITLPYFGSVLGMNPYDLRLYANTHPNISATLFLIALILGTWLVAQHKRRWLGVILLILGVALYSGIALTVSRTVMIQFAAFVAGLAFVGCMRLSFKAIWKRVLVAVPVAVVCLLVVFLSFGWAADGLTVVADSMRAVAETVSEPVKPLAAERDLMADLGTMTGRTIIYQQIFDLFGDHPEYLLTGMRNSTLAGTLQKYTSTHHAHNSFLQTVVNMGIPGLLMAVWFTVRGLWASARVIFSRRSTFANQVLAIGWMALLICTISESYLFTEYLTACNFPFYLLLGYTLENARSLKAKA